MVDDEERVGRRFQRFLKPFAHELEVDVCTSGQDALALLAERQYHVVCSDQRMPGMTGVQLLAKVRELNPNIVRILITAHADLQDIVAGINLSDVFRFLRKPFSNDDVIDTIREAAGIAKILLAHGETPSPANYDSEAERNVMVIGHNDELRPALREQFGGNVNFLYASSLLAGLPAILKYGCEVLVINYDPHEATDRLVLAVLKHYHPEILSILISDDHDIRALSMFINTHRIFRVESSSVDIGTLVEGIDAALILTDNYRKLNQQVLTQSVIQAPPPKATGLTPEIYMIYQRIIDQLDD